MSDTENPKSARRILVVDDHADTALALSRLLSVLGYETRVAGSIAQALEAAGQGPIDLLVTDIALPDGNGFELLSRLRAMGSPDLKGVTVSGYDEDEDRRRSQRAGFDAHIAKPIRFEQLESLAKQLLK